jgi:hypothetical protein
VLQKTVVRQLSAFGNKNVIDHATLAADKAGWVFRCKRRYLTAGAGILG